MARPSPDTETHCHCGAAYGGSDHCPECGCEQYESLHCWDADIGYAEALQLELDLELSR